MARPGARYTMTTWAALPAERNHRTRAAVLILALGLGILLAIVPFLMGLLGAPILTVLFDPVYQRFTRRMRPRLAATFVLLIAVIVVVLPVSLLAALLIGEAPTAFSGPRVDRVLAQVADLHVGGMALGAEIAKASGELFTWGSRQVVGLVGSITRLTINLFIAFLGFFYLMVSGSKPWQQVMRYVPFSESTIAQLTGRFASVTRATLLDIGLTALLQGTIVGTAFAITGLGQPVLWGTITGMVSVLPILGSAIVWLPGVAVLLLERQVPQALLLAGIGAIIASNIDNLVRPVVFKTVSNIHPVATLVGAFAGLEYFGILGVLIGPLAMAYFFELVRAFEREYSDAPAEEA